MASNRAVFFVDGSNWYHGCKAIGIGGAGFPNFARLSQKLAGRRDWIATRYYLGEVPTTGNLRLASDQQRFLAFLRALDPRISTHLGRLEPRSTRNNASSEIKHYLANLKVRIDPGVHRDLLRIANLHAVSTVLVEKAVDVQIAVDMVVMAERDQYDTAYLLSADGDLTPAVEAAMQVGKKVFVASPSNGARLAAVCTSYIRLRRPWFEGIYEK